MRYLFFLLLIPFIIIPNAYALEYISTNPTEDGVVTDNNNNNSCQDTGGTYSQTTNGVASFIGPRATASSNDCDRGYFEYPITIPTGAAVTKVEFIYEIASVFGADACDFYGMTTQPTTRTPAQIFDEIDDGTLLIDDDPDCATATGVYTLDLGATGITYVQSQLASGWVSIGVRANDETLGTGKQSDFTNEEGSPPPKLKITYVDGEAVTDLTATSVGGTHVDLSWTNPTTNSTAVIQSWRINFTTPHNENVASLAQNDTGSTATSYIVQSLTGQTPYSFQIDYWLNGTCSGGCPGSALSNIVNVTTLVDPTASFTPGTFDINATGTDDRELVFERNDINSTALFLNMTVDTDWNLACNLHYKFANINKTYTSIPNTTIDIETDAAAFQFLNVDNEVIDVYCWDQYDNSSNARYIITQTAFPLLDQIADFRSGAFGTEGNFGVFDFITLSVIIISMIGFNRVNPAVGAIMSAAIIGGAAFFGIVQWYTTMTAAFAIVIMYAITTTRKD